MPKTSPPALHDLQLYIHGEAVAARSGQAWTNTNPATGEALQQVGIANQADVDRAVQSAQDGFAQWRATSGLQRGRVLKRVEEILRARNNELALLETLDSGKPLQESQAVDIHWAADCFEYYAGVAANIGGRHMDFPDHFAYTRREPLGVCAGIGAWNYPIQVAAWKIAPALACGCAMVYKPAELTPITSSILAEVASEAGVPSGVLNIVHGDGKTGAMLSQHPRIAKVSLTGEVGTGRLVMADAATTLKHVTMELGGKSPLIVFADADIDSAVSAALAGNFFTQGEVCTNCTRVFVHASIKAAFTERLLARTKPLVVGDPRDPATQIGSLISRDHQQKVLAYIQAGVDEGAALLCGGGAPRAPALANGAFVEPTIFDNCTDEMTIVREEIFGPVLSLLSFDCEDEVLARANNTHYGLAAGVFTADLPRAHRVAAALEAGMCWINSYGVYEMSLPAGGFKQSGIGSENGLETIKQYTQTKTVYVNKTTTFPSPF